MERDRLVEHLVNFIAFCLRAKVMGALEVVKETYLEQSGTLCTPTIERYICKTTDLRKHQTDYEL